MKRERAFVESHRNRIVEIMEEKPEYEGRGAAVPQDYR